MAAQRLLVRITDRVNHKIDRRPPRRERREGGVEIVHIRHVAIDQQVAAKLIRERLDALQHHIALIGNREFSAMRAERLGDAPSE
jgi:hypothetical protein